MNSLAAVSILIGVLGVPVALLWAGRNFRRFSNRMLGAYRGAVVGYGVAALAVAVALVAPPYVWPPAPGLGRTLLAVALLAGPGLGAMVGGRNDR